MKILHKYMAKQLVVAYAFVGIVLMSIVWLTQSLRIIDMIISNGISIPVFFKLTALLLPNFILILSPIVLFVICIFLYSRMSLDRELQIMQASGMSAYKIAKPAFIFAILLTFINLTMSFYFVPASFTMFKELQWQMRYDLSNLLIKEGEFNPLGQKLSFYIKERDASGNLYGIMINDDRTTIKSVVLAQKGALINSSGAPRVIMENGSRQEVNLNEKKYSVLFFDNYLIDFGLAEDDGSSRFKNAKERYIWELLSATEGAGINADMVRKFRVEAHSRIVRPFNNLAFFMIAATSLLTSSFSRYGQARVIFLSIGIMVIVQSLSVVLEKVSARNMLFIPLMYINVIIPIALGLYVLKSDNFMIAMSKFKNYFRKRVQIHA